MGEGARVSEFIYFTKNPNLKKTKFLFKGEMGWGLGGRLE